MTLRGYSLGTNVNTAFCKYPMPEFSHESSHRIPCVHTCFVNSKAIYFFSYPQLPAKLKFKNSLRQGEFFKCISNSHISLPFLLIWNWNVNCTFIHSRGSLEKPYPIPDQIGQNLYPFSDQNSKTLPVGAAHTHMAYKMEWLPPEPQKISVSVIMLCLYNFMPCVLVVVSNIGAELYLLFIV